MTLAMTLVDGARLALLIAVSLAIGSFVGAVVLRLPAGETLWGRSHCPKCRAVLAPRDMVPLASYLWLGGRCRQCGAPQGRFYPAVELAALVLGVWTWTATSG